MYGYVRFKLICSNKFHLLDCFFYILFENNKLLLKKIACGFVKFRVDQIILGIFFSIQKDIFFCTIPYSCLIAF